MGRWQERYDARERHVRIPLRPFSIEGTLAAPPGASRFVLFAHGSGSGRFSPRNRFVASALNQAGMATLLLDLLTREEGDIDRSRGQHRFDIELLAGRLAVATDWVVNELCAGPGSVGYFGASTGAAAALVAAAARPSVVGAVVSRGGRPDLAEHALEAVHAPTLLIVGGDDPVVLRLNEDAAELLAAPHDLHVVAGAGHLFEEPGALEQVTALAARWFHRHLAAADIGAQPERPLI